MTSGTWNRNPSLPKRPVTVCGNQVRQSSSGCRLGPASPAASEDGCGAAVATFIRKTYKERAKRGDAV